MTSHSRILLMSCALALFGLRHMTAQPVEVFGGYTIGKMKPENDSNRATLNGWNSSITGYLTPRFGVTADFAGLYGAANPAATVTDASVTATSVSSVSVRQYSFMAGPQFRILRKERFESSIRALFGGAYGYLPAAGYNTLNQTTFAALFGSNFDINLSKRVAMRFSPALYLTQFGANQTQKNLRFSFGPVFRLGRGD